MSALPSSLQFLRPYIHKLRIRFRGNTFIRALLGKSNSNRIELTNSVSRLELQNLEALFQNLLDRYSTLESTVNWRLHGFPARVENIRLEQLPILAGSGALEKTISAMRQFQSNPQKLRRHALRGLNANSKAFLVLSGSVPDDNDSLLESLTNSIFVQDSSDIFTSEIFLQKKTRFPKSDFIEAPIIDAAARLTGNIFDLVWLNSAVERLSPIQLQTLFIRAKQGLNPKGKLMGVFADYSKSDGSMYWLDPSRLRPLSAEVIGHYAKAAGFTNCDFTFEKNELGLTVALFEIS